MSVEAKAMKDWIIIALLGGDITAREAAARLSAVEKAELQQQHIPDIRGLCMMSGHSQRECPGPGTLGHMNLIREGVGVSSVPGPSNAELEEEMRNDLELMRDEFHGGSL